MILITGGLGFIGSHVTRALLDAGEACVVTQHRTAEVPAFLQAELGSRLVVEPVELEDGAALQALGRRHAITGIVHLAAPGFGGEFLADTRSYVTSLTHVLEAAQAWGVRRVVIASAIGVYAGVPEQPWREDQPLPMLAPFPVIAFKKCAELVADYMNTRTDLQCVSVRIGAVFGPLQRPTSQLASRLAHAAVGGRPLDLSNSFFSVYAEEGSDTCYVKDAARAIALLQTTQQLTYRTYNVGSGRAVRNAELAATVQRLVPEADVTLPAGTDPHGLGLVPRLDITRLTADTGYEPQFDLEAALADYMSWLRAGHSK